ncbi:MAG: CTP:molybdopterin cytidylyltransferase MocA, partial [Planctomycetaceae bacterium]
MSLFAIVPAAGLSRRMGQPKLVMDLGGKAVIERLLTT